MHAKHVKIYVKIFGADGRLIQIVTDANPATLLANVERMRVAAAPSKNYCKHQGRSLAGYKRVRLLAQQGGTISPATSLKLVCTANKTAVVLEEAGQV